MIAEVDFPDPGGGVEKEGKPADPGPKLNPADGLDTVG